MKKLLGTSFAPKSSFKKRWKAQIVRRGRTLQLGAFEHQEEAARQYDNAAYHLREWSDRPVQYNYPEDFEKGKLIPDPTNATLVALAKLRDMFPDFEAKREDTAGESRDEKLDREGQSMINTIKALTQKLAPVVDEQAATIRLLRVKLAAVERERDSLLRAVEGLKAQAGQQIFTKVSGTTHVAQVGQVESHLS